MEKYKKLAGTGIVLTSLLFGNYQVLANKTNLETKVVQVEQEKKGEEIEKPLSYKVSDEIIIKDFLDSYLKKIIPKSSNFQKLKKKYGEKGVLEKYCSAHKLCLDLAFKYQDKNPGKEVLEKEYVILGQELSKKQHETSKGLSRVNYLDKDVIKAFEKWGQLKTGNFDRLLKAGKEIKINEGELKTRKQKQDYVKKLHNSAYSKEQYKKYVNEQNKANDELYAAMKSTLNFIEAAVGRKELETIRKMTNEVYEKPLKEYFGD